MNEGRKERKDGWKVAEDIEWKGRKQEPGRGKSKDV